MKNSNLYRELAANGNDSARVIADEMMGAMPGAEMNEADSSEAFATSMGELRGRAMAHGTAGEHNKAAEVHEERGRLHESRGEHEMAKDAYKDALAAHRAGDCWKK